LTGGTLCRILKLCRDEPAIDEDDAAAGLLERGQHLVARAAPVAQVVEQKLMLSVEAPRDADALVERHLVERLPVAPEQVRAWLPLETYPISAGVKGGLAGSVAMAVLACLYGLLKTGSIWYPINLLAAVVYAPSEVPSITQLNSFHAGIFFLAVVLHLVTSILVGLLYGATLPMFGRHPIVLGGLVAPVLWSGLLYSIMGILNPVLGSHIDWVWFMASQFAFGIVAGLAVLRQSRVPTHENLPFALRAGIEAPGLMSSRQNGEKRP